MRDNCFNLHSGYNLLPPHSWLILICVRAHWPQSLITAALLLAEVRGSEKNAAFPKHNTTVDMSEFNEIGAAIISLTEFPVMLEN